MNTLSPTMDRHRAAQVAEQAQLDYIERAVREAIKPLTHEIEVQYEPTELKANYGYGEITATGKRTFGLQFALRGDES